MHERAFGGDTIRQETDWKPEAQLENNIKMYVQKIE
jgi:hypothetical protein